MEELDADALGKMIAGIAAIGVVTAALSKLGSLLGLDGLRAENKEQAAELRAQGEKLHALELRIATLEARLQGVASDVDKAGNEIGAASALLREIKEAIPGARNVRR